MIRLIIVCSFLGFAFLPGPAQAQSVGDRNARMMDSLQMEVFSIWCQGQLDYPHGYSRQKSRRLARVLQNLNAMSTDTLTRAGLLRSLANFHRAPVTVDTTQYSGGLTFFEVRIELSGYLRARLGFTCLGSYVVAQRFELQPETILFCADHGQGFFDFNYCKNVYAPVLDFPLRYVRQEYFYFMHLSAHNRSAAAAAYPQYAPFLALDSTNAPARPLSESYILWENTRYNLNNPDPWFVDLVRSDNSRLLTGMLYAPNHYYAFNAMEALTYMASTRQLTLAPSLRRRIDQLKNWKMTDEQIVEKYRIALSTH